MLRERGMEKETGSRRFHKSFIDLSWNPKDIERGWSQKGEVGRVGKEQLVRSFFFRRESSAYEGQRKYAQAARDDARMISQCIDFEFE